MSFLTPLFLLGALAVAGPVIFHLVRRSTRKRVMFSAMRFLESSAPRLERRSRIQNPWLLFLRCLIVALLAAGFARPFLRNDAMLPTNTETRRDAVVVLDVSGSMQRTGQWEAAVDRTIEVAESLAPSDSFALVTAAARARTVLSAEQWSGAPPADRTRILQTVLEDIQPGWNSTSLDSGVELAMEQLEDVAAAPGRSREASIHVVSDFGAGSRISGLAGRIWPDDVSVRLEALNTEMLPNASLHWLGWTTANGDATAARIKVVNHTDSLQQLSLSVEDPKTGEEIGKPRDETLAAREARLVRIDLPPGITAPLRAELSGDGERFDNAVWFIPPERRHLQIPVIGAGSDARDPATPLYYLTRASAGWRDSTATWVPSIPEETASASAEPFLVLGSALQETTAREEIRQRIQAGTTALLLLNDAEMLDTASNLAGETISATDPPPASDLMLGSIDFGHPLFAPFADPRFSDFTRIRFWRPLALTLPPASNAKVVARFETGAPAIVEYTIGDGRMILWPGNWTPTASQWVLSSKFVPWVQTLIERAAGGPPRPNIGTVGEPLPGEVVADAPDQPGIHTVVTTGEESDIGRTIALNTPEAESNTDPLSADAWEQLGVPIASMTQATAQVSDSGNYARAVTAIEAEQKLWRWLLLAAIGLFAMESMVAWRLGRPASAAL